MTTILDVLLDRLTSEAAARARDEAEADARYATLLADYNTLRTNAGLIERTLDKREQELADAKAQAGRVPNGLRVLLALADAAYFANTHQKVAAIKKIRDTFDVSLREAKDFVEMALGGNAAGFRETHIHKVT